MFDRLDVIENRYEEINALLSDPAVCSDIKKLTELSKEQRQLEKIVNVYREYKNIKEQLKELDILRKEDDKELASLAELEYDELKHRPQEIEEQLKIMLLPKDPNDDKNVVIEIRGAAGGDEANIFAGDLFRMYFKYCESKGWKTQILDSTPSEAGGYSQIEFMVSGEMVYSFLKYESGAHRVQRIPTTEANGRIQTSTATVLVMPEASEIEFELNPADLKFDTFCSSGPGGQSVNTTKSAVRVTHIPTGVAVACQQGKSQHENKASAIALLKTRLYDRMVQEQEQKEGAQRKALIGSGDRSEKIRTYNYPQNRVTDHRINFSIQRLDAIIDGKLDLVLDALLNEQEKRKLAGETNK